MKTATGWLVSAAVVMMGGCDVQMPVQRGPNVAEAAVGRTIVLETLPATTTEFLTLRDRLANTPEGTAALMVAAMLAYNEDPERGTTFATILLGPSRCRKGTAWQGREPTAGFLFLLGQLRRKPGIARSLVVGTSPANDYALPAGPIRIAWQPDPRSTYAGMDKTKLFLPSTGADRPRPITLSRTTAGPWEVHEASSLFLGVR